MKLETISKKLEKRSGLIYFFSKRTFGPPTRVQSDRGTEFKGAVKTFLKMCGIQNTESRPYHPQSQGKIERSHGTWKTKLKFDILNGAPGNIASFRQNIE